MHSARPGRARPERARPERARRRHRAAGRVRTGASPGTLLALAVPIGLLGSGALVWQATDAAFTASTQSPGNTWSTGTVQVSDDDAGSALFTATNLRPDSYHGGACIVVSNDGTLDPEVRLHVSVTGDVALAEHLDLTLGVGTGGSFSSCSGPVGYSGSQVFAGSLADLGAADTWEEGLAPWFPTVAGQTRTYHVTYRLAADAPDSVQGLAAGATFTWEARS